MESLNLGDIILDEYEIMKILIALYKSNKTNYDILILTRKYEFLFSQQKVYISVILEDYYLDLLDDDEVEFNISDEKTNLKENIIKFCNIEFSDKELINLLKKYVLTETYICHYELITENLRKDCELLTCIRENIDNLL